MSEDTDFSAKLAWDEDGQPYSSKFNDVYFSKANGAKESYYVFTQQNKLATRYRELLSESTSQPRHFIIGETGFGSGLNFLIAWQTWRSACDKSTLEMAMNQNRIAHLHFLSVEKYPLTREQLTRVLRLWPDLSPYTNALISQYPPQPAYGLHRLTFDDGSVSLSVFFGDAAEGLAQLSPTSNLSSTNHELSFGSGQFTVDAWFLDGFAPAKNPSMWSLELCKSIASLSGENTTLSTFTAAGQVRRNLEAVGFRCQKTKGFGNKREMLIAAFSPKNSSNYQEDSINSSSAKAYHHSLSGDSYWYLMDGQRREAQSALVIGGGLAGCHTAFALARQGIRVKLIEKENSLAQHASGNSQGAVYTRLSPHQDPLSQFNLAAQIFANNFYSTNNFFDTCGERCGVLHLAHNKKLYEHFQTLQHTFSQDPFCFWVPMETSESLCGLPLKSAGLFLPESGWLNPPQVCAMLAAHKNIDICSNTFITHLHFTGKSWQALDSDQTTHSADIAIICNAFEATQFQQTKTLPIKQIRGQVSYLPANTETRKLRTVICGQGYIAPAQSGIHCAGATFTLHNQTPQVTQEDHKKNLENLAQLSEKTNYLSNGNYHCELEGRVGFRCTSPDYFPITGPVPKTQKIIETFSRLRKKANAIIPCAGEYHEGLFINTGFGSRGLAYAPLCAELLVNLILNHPLPVERRNYLHLHPARFLIRDLMRNKI